VCVTISAATAASAGLVGDDDRSKTAQTALDDDVQSPTDDRYLTVNNADYQANSDSATDGDVQVRSVSLIGDSKRRGGSKGGAGGRAGGTSFMGFRSDLGKRYINDGDDDDDDVESEVSRRASAKTYRVRGKSFKSDLGKRSRGTRINSLGQMFRSDLGRRSLISAPAAASGLYDNVVGYSDTDQADIDDELDEDDALVSRLSATKRRLMFRSDLGKRLSAADEYSRGKMFKADLGKRRMFRHDLG
jgi:hypothetical protein